MALETTNPYANKADHTLVKTSAPFQVEDKANAAVSYGRTYEYRAPCSAGKRFFAVFLAVVTLGLALIAKAVRDTCAGRKFLKVDVALTPKQVNQFKVEEKVKLVASKVNENEREQATKTINEFLLICSEMDVDFSKDDWVNQITQLEIEKIADEMRMNHMEIDENGEPVLLSEVDHWRIGMVCGKALGAVKQCGQHASSIQNQPQEVLEKGLLEKIDEKTKLITSKQNLPQEVLEKIDEKVKLLLPKLGVPEEAFEPASKSIAVILGGFAEMGVDFSKNSWASQITLLNADDAFNKFMEIRAAATHGEVDDQGKAIDLNDPQEIEDARRDFKQIMDAIKTFVSL